MALASDAAASASRSGGRASPARTRYRRRSLRSGRRWIRHLERESRSPLRRRALVRPTCRGRWSVPRISTATDRGRAIRTTAPSGFRRPSLPIGRRTATATGPRSAGWGPTWVDSAPWGYAPFHYGRWAFICGRWGWCPGGIRRASRLGAGAGRLVRRPGLGISVVTAAGRSTAGCRSAGASRTTPAGADARSTAGRASTGPTASNVTERPSAPPTRHVNLAVPGALSAVPATRSARRRPVRSNLVNVPRSSLVGLRAGHGPIPADGIEQRQAPDAAGSRRPARGVDARVVSDEPASRRATFRPARRPARVRRRRPARRGHLQRRP